MAINTFLPLGESHDVNIEDFSRRLLNLFDARNFNCAAAEVTQANFKTSSPFVYLLAAEILFCLRPTTKRFPFSL